MVVTRYIGKVNLDWSGKSLYQLLTNLRNNGVGRVVVRHCFLKRYPEKSYYRLTAVEPNFTDPRRRAGQAWGYKVFRGKEFPGICVIHAGHKADWKLIPVEEEEEFCKLSEVDVREKRTVPVSVPFPPLLEAMILAEKASKEENLTEPLRLSLNIVKNKFTTSVDQIEQ